MKRFIKNPDTNNLIDADGVKGKKIIVGKLQRNQQIQLFADKEGKTRLSSSCIVRQRNDKVRAKKERAEKKERAGKKDKKERAPKKDKKERAPKKDKKQERRTMIQTIFDEPAVRAPDPAVRMRIVNIPLPPVSNTNDISQAIRRSMTTFHDDHIRRHNSALEEASRNMNFMREVMLERERAQDERRHLHQMQQRNTGRQLMNMMRADEQSRRAQDEFRRENLHNNINNLRVRKFVILKKKDDKKKQEQEKEHKLRLQNQALKKKLEAQRKANEERQKRLKALEKRHKKK